MSSLRQSVSDTVVNLDVNVPAAATKMGIASAGAAYSMTGYTMSDLVALATLVFVLLQIGLLMPKYAALYRAWRSGKKVKVELHD